MLGRGGAESCFRTVGRDFREGGEVGGWQTFRLTPIFDGTRAQVNESELYQDSIHLSHPK